MGTFAVVLATPIVRRIFRPLVQPRLDWLFHPVVHREPGVDERGPRNR